MAPTIADSTTEPPSGWVVRALPQAEQQRLFTVTTRLQVLATMLAFFWVGILVRVITINDAFLILLREIHNIPAEIMPRLLDSFACLAWVGLGLSALLFLGVRRRGVSERRLVTYGLVFGVVASLLISTTEAMIPISPASLRDPTWTALWVAVFPLMVPAKPKHAMFAVAGCVLGQPLAIMMVVTVGVPSSPTAYIAMTLPPTLLAATWSLVPVTVAYNWRQRVEQARDQARRMGSYHLEDLVGRGGMGEVWRATHGMLQRPVAIKLIRADKLAADAEEGQARFLEEARATAELECPHSVRVFDFGVTEDGRVFSVMEFLRGLDLEKLVKRYGPLPPARTVHLLRQVCKSLTEAHSMGIVHRDIKPSNLVNCHYGMDMDFLKVVDFGLASRARSGPESPSTGGFVTGTPAFLAPELAKGLPADPRTDLYAVGCVAWWLLTGRLLFERESAMQTLRAHVEDAPPLEILTSEVDVPADLRALLIELLAKDPNERPATANAVEQRLVAIATQHPWPSARAERWWSTHRPLDMTSTTPPVLT